MSILSRISLYQSCGLKVSVFFFSRILYPLNASVSTYFKTKSFTDCVTPTSKKINPIKFILPRLEFFLTS